MAHGSERRRSGNPLLQAAAWAGAVVGVAALLGVVVVLSALVVMLADRELASTSSDWPEVLEVPPEAQMPGSFLSIHIEADENLPSTSPTPGPSLPKR